MRTIVFSAAFTLALALLGTTATNAAPANGAALGNAVKTDSVVHQVPCAMRRVCGRRGCVTRRVCW